MWALALLSRRTHWGTGMAPQHSKRRALCLDPVCGFPPAPSQASDPFPTAKEHWKKDGIPSQRQKDRNHGKKTDLKFPLPHARWPLGTKFLCVCVTARQGHLGSHCSHSPSPHPTVDQHTTYATRETLQACAHSTQASMFAAEVGSSCSMQPERVSGV